MAVITKNYCGPNNTYLLVYMNVHRVQHKKMYRSIVFQRHIYMKYTYIAGQISTVEASFAVTVGGDHQTQQKISPSKDRSASSSLEVV